MGWWPFPLLAALAAVNAGAPAVLAVCALTAVWLLQPWWRRGGFVAGLITLNGVLVLLTPWFGLFTPVSYVHAFRRLDWPWQPVAVAGCAVVAGTAQASDVDDPLIWAAVVAGNVVPMCGFSWFVRRAVRHEAERETALADARDANRRLAVSLAENATLHERLLAQATEAAIRDERQRMAREIHDTLAQGLTGIISQLRAAAHADDDPPRRQRHIAAAATLAGDSLTEARRSVHALRPEPLRTARLAEALDGVAARWSALHGIPARFTTTGTPLPLPPDTEDALLRVAQEALANVARHARATRVGVTLSFLDAEVALDIRDDGRGLPAAAGPHGEPGADPGAGLGVDRAVGVDLPVAAGRHGESGADSGAGSGGGFGLIAMRQRMEDLSGTLQIESEPGDGTGISARVPLPTTDDGRPA